MSTVWNLSRKNAWYCSVVLLAPVRALDPLHVAFKPRVVATFAGLIPVLGGMQVCGPLGFATAEQACLPLDCLLVAVWPVCQIAQLAARWGLQHLPERLLEGPASSRR